MCHQHSDYVTHYSPVPYNDTTLVVNGARPPNIIGQVLSLEKKFWKCDSMFYQISMLSCSPAPEGQDVLKCNSCWKFDEKMSKCLELQHLSCRECMEEKSKQVLCLATQVLFLKYARLLKNNTQKFLIIHVHGLF